MSSNPDKNSNETDKSVTGHKHKHNQNLPFNISFIFAIVAIACLSAAFVYEFFIHSKPSYWIPCLCIFLFLFLMVEWSYFATTCTDPGRVPFYYGLSEQIHRKERKYCLQCHNFKPERTHHCSHCKRCVLNMDHHCPWINNCVGFRNRKFFILFLIYISLGLIFMSIMCLLGCISAIKTAIQTKSTDFHFVLKIIITVITIPLTFMLTFFALYHLKMVVRNTTTLEQMSLKKVQDQNGIKQQPNYRYYDVGVNNNLQQVFGENKLFWPIPLHCGGPKGNGTTWPVLENKNVKLYEPLPKEDIDKTRFEEKNFMN